MEYTDEYLEFTKSLDDYFEKYCKPKPKEKTLYEKYSPVLTKVFIFLIVIQVLIFLKIGENKISPKQISRLSPTPIPSIAPFVANSAPYLPETKSNHIISLPVISVFVDPTAVPTEIPVEEVVEEAVEVLRSSNVRISYYWPPLGGTNCSRFYNGVCVSRTASGDSWQAWIGKGAACPPSWNFGTKFRLPDGSIWTCVDRGGAIQYVNGVPYVDLLISKPPYPFGSIVQADFIE